MVRLSEKVFSMVWKQWIRSLLVRQAKEQLAARAVDAVSDSTEGTSEPDASIDVAIVVNQTAEAGSLLDRLTGVLRIHPQDFQLYRGDLDGRRVMIAQVEGGSPVAARVTKAMIQAHHPRWVIAAGFSVALTADFRQDELIIGSHVMDTKGGRLKIDIQNTSQQDSFFKVGTVLTCERRPKDQNTRRALAASHHADVADTTSMGIAQACCEAGVPCLVIRIVRERLEDQIPREIQHSSQQASFSGRLGSLIGGTLRRPGTARDWLHSKQTALCCADSLADFLKIVISRWLPPPPVAEACDSSNSLREQSE